MNDYTLKISFIIGMNYFSQKELGNLDFFSVFSSNHQTFSRRIFGKWKTFPKILRISKLFQPVFGPLNEKYLPLKMYH